MLGTVKKNLRAASSRGCGGLVNDELQIGRAENDDFVGAMNRLHAEDGLIEASHPRKILGVDKKTGSFRCRHVYLDRIFSDDVVVACAA
jgi:hypothetical protein